MDNRVLAGMIDHTLLKSEASHSDIDRLCAEAEKFGFYSVCVHPIWVNRASLNLKKTDIRICSVVGFPTGCHRTETKKIEALTAVEDGADEIDMVIAMGALKSQNWKQVLDDIREVLKATNSKTLKVILETDLLDESEKIRATEICIEAGAHFVKTSTGFVGEGATEKDIRLLRSIVGNRLGVKASGGIRTREKAEALVQAGATRLGTSQSISILQMKNSSENLGSY